MLYCEQSSMVIQELQAVALLDEIAVEIVSKCDAILCRSATSCIIAKGVAVECSQLSAISPSCRLSSVRGRVANYIIHKRFAIVGHKLVAVVSVGVELASSIQKVQLA